MNTSNNDLETPLTPEEKALIPMPANRHQAAIDAIMEQLLHSMRVLATDEHRRKEIGMLLI